MKKVKNINAKILFYYSAISKDLLKYSSPNILENSVNKQVANFLKERCSLLGFIPNSRTSLNKNEEEIKLFGDYNMHIDNGVWCTINKDTHFDEIYVNNEELSLLMFNILKTYDLVNDKENLKIMQESIEGNNIKKISDIVNFLEKLKKTI